METIEVKSKFNVDDIVVIDEINGVWRIKSVEYDDKYEGFVYLVKNVKSGWVIFVNDHDETLELYKEKVILLPCPSCGNTNLIWQDDDYYANFKYIEDVKRGWTIICDGTQGGCGLRLGYTDQDKINEWNSLPRG